MPKLKTIHQELSWREKTPVSYKQIRMCLPEHIQKSTIMQELDKLPPMCTDAQLFKHASNVLLYCNRYNHKGQVIASHWVTVLRRNKNEVDFFDPLGTGTPIQLLHLLGHVKSPGFGYWATNRRGKINSNHRSYQKPSMEDQISTI